MRKHVFVVSLGLLVLLSGQSVYAVEYEPCRRACEAAEVTCRNQADALPNELDKQDAYNACDSQIVGCCNDCTPEVEKAQREQLEKAEQEKALQEKAQQEKTLQEQQNNERNGFVPLNSL